MVMGEELPKDIIILLDFQVHHLSRYDVCNMSEHEESYGGYG